MILNFCIITFTLIVLHTVRSDNSELHSENATFSRILSRRKRFLIYPDGSSFQLVLCVQTSAIIPIGDIFLYGNIASLAWTLPTDPSLFHMLKGDMVMRRGDMKEIHYLDQDGNIVAKVPYKRPSPVRPIIAKRSINDKMPFKQKLQLKLAKQMRNEKQLNRDYLKYEHANEKTVEFHRTSRVGLYEKLEKLFTALGGNGRQCVLRKVCEASRLGTRQGTFFHQLLTIVFTLPKGRDFEKQHHKMYDEAHTYTEDDCDRLYPGCLETEIASP